MSKRIINCFGVAMLVLAFNACTIPPISNRYANKSTPAHYANKPAWDTVNSAALPWRQYFTDPYLASLIDTALVNNQELNITLQEIEISRNEIRARKGEYLPFVGISGGIGVDKVGRYTNIGASEANTEIARDRETPDPLPDYRAAAVATWELDIWRKLRNAKDAAVARYLATTEGKNFMVTNLIGEIADTYYELLALDNQLALIRQNIEIQNSALKIVKLQKEAAQVTELAVRRFEAQVLNTQSIQYDLLQRITETENRLNYLVGRFPQAIARTTQPIDSIMPSVVASGIPSQLLSNRPDIRRAEQELVAAKLDVKVARARFYPSIGITAAAGFQAFNPSFLVKAPESMLYSIAGELTAPLINRNAIKAAYYNANAQQISAVYRYEQTILNAYVEVANQLAKISNLQSGYALKQQQVQALSRSVAISNDLFTSARADYMEVLLTQRDALEARFELIETKRNQLSAWVNTYRALGGGWR